MSEVAPALLGSTLLAAAETHEKLRPAPASSGSAVIDDMALEGGFRYGEITAIAGATGTGKTLLAYHASASHLLSHPTGEVAFIDTTGSFSPLRLRNVLTFRLRARKQRAQFVQSGYVYEKTAAADQSSEAEIMKEATGMLDHVKVMRVFDLAGVAEAIGEVRQLIEDAKFSAEQAEGQSRRRSEIGDSEDEDEDDVVDEIEVPHLEGKANRNVGIIIIDTMTNVVSAMVTRNQIQVGINSSKNPDYQRRPEEHVSVFASTLGKPALGKTFTYLIDTSVFLSSVPKTSADAMAVYGEQLGPESWQRALIIEVMKDRCGGREGRWAAFEIASSVKLVPC